MVVKLADNEAVRLLGLSERTSAAALPLANHRSPFPSGGDAVPVAFQDFLGNPANDGRGVLIAVELSCKLRFELFDV